MAISSSLPFARFLTVPGLKSNHHTGAVAVLWGERIIAQGAAGVRKRGTAERITLDDRFHLGSCTKAMTATLVAMVVEEGRLNWTTTLGELFADTVKPMHPPRNSRCSTALRAWHT